MYKFNLNYLGNTEGIKLSEQRKRKYVEDQQGDKLMKCVHK